MPRKVILDVDPGIDDAVALTMALFDPRLEVVAVTAVAGNVSGEQASRNVQAIIEQLDPPRWPRIGVAAEDPPPDPELHARHLFGPHGLGDAPLPVAELHHRHPADKVMAEEIRAAPDAVTIIALGPLTNVAALLRREPAVVSQLGQLIIMGGSVAVGGNASPAAEFNMLFDPASAQAVFQSRTTKTLIPLDVTSQVVMTYDLLDQIPSEASRAGRFLRKILPYAFRTHRQLLGLEGVHLHDAVALVAATQPELFGMQRLAGDVETGGQLSRGTTVFDRRQVAQWRPNMDVALQVDSLAVMDAIMRGLTLAAQDPE